MRTTRHDEEETSNTLFDVPDTVELLQDRNKPTPRMSAPSTYASPPFHRAVAEPLVHVEHLLQHSRVALGAHLEEHGIGP